MNDDFHISKFGKELQALRITIITTISPIQEENYDMLSFFINDVWIVISGVNYNSIPRLQLAAIAYNWLSKLWSILWIAMFSNSFTQFYSLYIDYNCLQLPHLIMALIGDYLDYEQWLVQTITAGYWINTSPGTNLGPLTHVGTNVGVCCSSCVLAAQHWWCATHSSASTTTCLPTPAALLPTMVLPPPMASPHHDTTCCRIDDLEYDNVSHVTSCSSAPKSKQLRGNLKRE